MTMDGRILVLCEHPPLVLVLDPDSQRAASIALVPGDRGVLADVFDESSSAREGLLVLPDWHLLVAKEKDPPLLVEFGPRDADAAGVVPDSLGTADWGPVPPAGDLGDLRALAAWRLDDDIDDISDLASADGTLYCLSDRSRRVVAVELPLDPGAERAHIHESWELSLPERRGEPDGKPEGLAVTGDRTLLVGLDTETPRANLCWFPS